MKKIIWALIAIGCFSACNTYTNMTKEEKELTYNGKIDEPFRVLITANEEDSLLLRKKSTDIENVENIANDKDWQFFIERLKLTMAVESGVGISAVQVGVLRNLFLFMRLDKPEFPVEVAINPRIVAHSPEEICFEDDGCLSIPGESADSRRYAWIDVEYYNEKGELIKERLSGVSRQGDFTGIVFQHEYDHLQGVLYIDKIWNE
ncbi:MAG: peptide deformylase [Prevotella sp.]|nr:peptide deformylase [Prevotella sp.]